MKLRNMDQLDKWQKQFIWASKKLIYNGIDFSLVIRELYGQRIAHRPSPDMVDIRYVYRYLMKFAYKHFDETSFLQVIEPDYFWEKGDLLPKIMENTMIKIFHEMGNCTVREKVGDYPNKDFYITILDLGEIEPPVQEIIDRHIKMAEEVREKNKGE